MSAKRYKIILIDQISCANCYAMQNELRPLCIKMGIEFELLTDSSVDLEFIKKYDIVSYPTGLLLDNDELLGKFKGYQPTEILEIWLDTKLNERGNKR